MQHFGIVFADIPHGSLSVMPTFRADSAFPVEFVNAWIETQPAPDEAPMQGRSIVDTGEDDWDRFVDRDGLIVVKTPEQQTEFFTDGRLPQAILDAVAPGRNEIFVSLVHGAFDLVPKIIQDNVQVIHVIHEKGL